MSKYMERARTLRAIEVPHYNCAQAVLLPFAPDAGVAEETAYQLAANFGGGMKMGSVCGAITGGLMALGLYGVDDPAVIQRYYQRLRENHEGLLDCEPLLARNSQLGREKKPHCDDLVFECVALVEQLLQENGKI